MNRDEALRRARDALARGDFVLTRVAGAERYFSLRGFWFRWSIGLEVDEAATGQLVIGHVHVEIFELTGRITSVEIPAENARVFDPFWHPPDPLWWRAVLCILVPLSLLAFVLISPFAWSFDVASERLRDWTMPRCSACKRKL